MCTTKCSTLNGQVPKKFCVLLNRVCHVMPHQSISLREANQNFSRVMAAVERGEVFVITRRGQEVARLAPLSHAAHVSPDAGAAVAKTLTDAALAERMRKLETLVDKLLSALSVSDTK